MLILTRKPVEGKNEIIIGDKLVVIALLGIHGNQARIGITVQDQSISIHRGEIFKESGPHWKGEDKE